MKVMVSFPEESLAEVDHTADEEHRSRGELPRETIRLYVEVRGGRRRPSDASRVQAAVATQEVLARLAPGTGDDSTADVRHWREGR